MKSVETAFLPTAGLVGAVSRGCLPQLGHRVIGVNPTGEQMLRAKRSPIVVDKRSTKSSPMPSRLAR
jgi:hypothetical protein